MDKLDFVEGIKILSSCYQKVISNDDISIWYEMLQDIDPEVFKKAIIVSSKLSTIFTLNSILELSIKSNTMYLLNIIYIIYYMPVILPVILPVNYLY